MMFEFKPLGEIKEVYPLPPEVQTYAQAESNRNGNVRYVSVSEPHPVFHWPVNMIADVREGVYVRCEGCSVSHEPHVIANEYWEDVEVITAKLNAEDDDSHVVDPKWLAQDPNH